MSSPISARVAIISLLALTAAGCDRQSAAPGQANAQDAGNAAASNSAAISPDEAAPSAAPTTAQVGIDRSHKGEAAPTTGFAGPDGKPTTIAAFAGKPVLVNLWATWCGPCVEELPTLGKAAAVVRVAAISQDAQAGATVPAFLKSHGAAALTPYLDAKMALSVGYGVSLPMTVLFDSQGKEVWRWHGGNDWSSAAAKALIAEAR